MSSTVTPKGRVTILKPIRDHLGIKPGAKVVFEIASGGSVVLRAAEPGNKPPSRFEQASGMADTQMTTDEIMRLLRSKD